MFPEPPQAAPPSCSMFTNKATPDRSTIGGPLVRRQPGGRGAVTRWVALDLKIKSNRKTKAALAPGAETRWLGVTSVRSLYEEVTDGEQQPANTR